MNNEITVNEANGFTVNESNLTDEEITALRKIAPTAPMEELKIPPPFPPAELPVTVLVSSVAVPALKIPPPFLPAELLARVLLVSVTVPTKEEGKVKLKIPPPFSPALFWDRVVPVNSTLPVSLKIPPP